ncbi:MAG: ATP-binding protein [Deltaproteobacteria bacterium]|nr:ATP-binding protein [Deltaproteobacteria bacterium]
MIFFRLSHKLKIFPRSIGFKVFVFLSILLGCAFLFILSYHLRTYTAYLEEEVKRDAIRMSQFIINACYYSMLNNDREGLQNIIMNVGKEKGVDEIKIYNRKGVVSFSKDRGEIHSIKDKRSAECYLCHGNYGEGMLISAEKLTRIVVTPFGSRQIQVLNPIVNSPECYNAICHAHKKNEKKLGLLDVKLSLKSVDEEIARTKKRMVTYSLAIIFITALVKGLFVLVLVHRPVKRLIKGVREVGRMNLDYKIDVKSKDEIGELAISFNEMTEELKRAHDALKEWSEKLEEKVKEKTEELKRAHAQIVMTEKMASLGKLSASVAHEINNPIFGILSYAKLSLRHLEEADIDPGLAREIKTNLQFIADEAKRCGDIVRNLLIFAKKTTGIVKEEHLSSIVETSIRLVEHTAKMKRIDIVKEIESGEDTIFADSNALTQVFVAILVNAVEALKEGGLVKVKTVLKDEEVEVWVEDNGPGIPEEILPHIFEPFFTTKESEKSVGLGLSVAYGIVDQHGGRIEIESRPNKGSLFKIILPRKYAAFA